jgi:hypothetical protein
MRIIALIACVLMVGCSSVRVETDYGGSGDFIVKNKCSFSIRVEFATVLQRSSDVDTSGIIFPDSSETILSDAIIGNNVTPAMSLSFLKIFKVENSPLVLKYEQNPIDESKWKIEKRYSSDFGHTDNTFAFTDSMMIF